MNLSIYTLFDVYLSCESVLILLIASCSALLDSNTLPETEGVIKDASAQESEGDTEKQD